MANSVLIPVFTLFIVLVCLIILLNYLYNYLVLSSAPLEWGKAKKEGRLSLDLRKLHNKYPHKSRFYAMWLQIERLKKDAVPGDFAEVGVYKGDSAVILHAMDPDRDFHLFDTFGGFPPSDLEGEKGEAATYTSEDFAGVDMQALAGRFHQPEKIHIYKGYFPETAKAVEHFRFAMVNLDADLYKPTKAALEFFYPRLSPGGVIFIHDYNHKWPGIIRSVDEFAVPVPETPVFMPDADGTVILVKNK